MVVANTVATLDGLFKEVYADKIQNLIPESVKITRAIGFRSDSKIGNLYHQPVVVAGEHGVTYAGPAAGAFALNTSVAMTMQDAQVDAFQILLRSQIDYEAAAKAVSGGERAFVKATRHLLTENMRSASKRLEISLLYGQSAFGLAEVLQGAVVATSGTTTTLTIAAAQWASGIWSGLEGAIIEVFNDAVVVGDSGTGIYTLTTVDNNLKELLLTSSSADATALVTSVGANDVQLWFEGQLTNDMAGIEAIVLNTGTLFNINAASFNLWRGNTFDATSGQLTMGKILSAVSVAVDRGLDENVTVFLNPKAFTDVSNDQAALRVFDSSFNENEARNGFKGVTFIGMNGEITLEPTSIVKEGEAYVLPTGGDTWIRIGAQELSFNRPGHEGTFFHELENSAGYEFRSYTDQAIFTKKPANSTKIINIVNSA